MNVALLEPTTERLPLEPGDRLSRAEFERRYHLMPNCKKAELIEGVVYMPSPARYEGHSRPQSWLAAWLVNYMAATPGTNTADNGTLRPDLENEPQPDCMLFVDPTCGGSIHISKDDYLVGPPEFIAEVSGSTAATDRGPKLRTFQRHGVNEYFIWLTEKQRIEWYSLRGGEYVLLQPGADGVIKSEVFPGLWLDVVALLNGDLMKVFAVQQQGLASAEHLAFVERLNESKTQS